MCMCMLAMRSLKYVKMSLDVTRYEIENKKLERKTC